MLFLDECNHNEAKKVVLFPEIGRVKKFLSLTRPHSRMCIRLYIYIYIYLYIFNIKKQTNKQKKQEYKKSK